MRGHQVFPNRSRQRAEADAKSAYDPLKLLRLPPRFDGGGRRPVANREENVAFIESWPSDGERQRSRWSLSRSEVLLPGAGLTPLATTKLPAGEDGELERER
jgi:hypothetical protein